MDESKEKIQELIDAGWIKTWMAFEVHGVSKKVVKEAIEAHINKIKDEKRIQVFDEKFSKAQELDASADLKQKGVQKVYSQIVEITLLAQELETLINVTINYGPSAVELIEPKKITLKMRDLQNSLNSITDMMHKFAAAGRGGLLISSR